ncbi:MAG: hypothetical protein ETSY1_32035 [Candidatus Entotheonella factor]|uniref:Uncharacterized protein n=1 Tax=Entotheonella factor TaxID=1429438 RepID=W4LBI0_ENTF1|nr:MAG: hypothetical protein ETSY1_32035 [Candidatus Entotheonella factor]
MSDSQESEFQLERLRQQIVSLTTDAEVLVDRLSQNLMAIHVASETLLIALNQGESISSQELLESLTLIKSQSESAIDRLRDARRRLGWDPGQLGR